MFVSCGMSFLYQHLITTNAFSTTAITYGNTETQNRNMYNNQSPYCLSVIYRVRILSQIAILSFCVAIRDRVVKDALVVIKC